MGEAVREPCTPPPPPCRKGGFVSKDTPPTAAFPLQCFCSLSPKTTHGMGFHFRDAVPNTPRSHPKDRAGLKPRVKAGRPGRVRWRRHGPDAPRSCGPLAGPGHPSGPHRRLHSRASALRHAGVAGAEADALVTATSAGPSLAGVRQPPLAVREKPTRPPPGAQ
jgi:hypothetical protein